MNNWTRVFLVLLRLSIGWHFAVEGFDKVESRWKGPSTSSKPWTSAPYLREASGPLAPFFRWQAGDPDEQALLLFEVEPGEAASNSRMPPALDKSWNEYAMRFSGYYDLTEDQRTRVGLKLDEAKGKAVAWLLGLEGEKETERSDFGASYKAKEKFKQRVDQYRAKLKEVREFQEELLPRFGNDVLKQKLRTAKTDATRMRTDLLSDLDGLLQDSLKSLLTPEQLKKEPLPSIPPPPSLVWTDRLVSYGLLAVGIGLLLGIFTRLSCVGGAVFLLMFYLAMPSLPGVPENLKAEGHYLFINKNIIEMLALLALATTASGCWLGLDGLLRFLNPFTYKRTNSN